MLQSQVRAGSWTLEQDGMVLAFHSVEKPFATAVKREKTYTEKRGTYREEVKETARSTQFNGRIPPDRYQTVSDRRDPYVLFFYASGHSRPQKLISVQMNHMVRKI